MRPVTLQPPKAIQLLGLPLVCMAMFALVGGHWATLQIVAWSQMVVSYSKNAGSFSEGVERTFSGKYPCAMCKKIAAGQKQESRKPTLAKSENKISGVVARTYIVHLPAAGDHAYPPLTDSLFPSRSDCPPTPVPISA